MGSSFTEFRGRGFWADDGALEVWLYFLSEEAKAHADASWLRKAAEDWRIQATVRFVGCISASLDEHLALPDRVDVAIGLAEKALKRLREWGNVIPRQTLNSLGVGGPTSEFTRDVEATVFTNVGEAFIKLLRGELTTDASTSPLV